MGILGELRRRNVIRMAGLYLVGAWLVVQVAGTLLPMFEAPAWVARTVVIVLAIGFVPALVFAWVFELAPEGLRRDLGPATESPLAQATARRMDRVIIAVMALALGYFAVDKFVLAPRTAATTAAQSAGSDKSIAVLPLANDSGDKEQQYFSDGISEDLITALSQIEGLKVIGRSSSFQFRDSKDDARAVGTKLGVAHVLEGSVRRAADTVRISAQLISTRDGSTLWSQKYDRAYRDLFALQDEITAAVAAALKARLLAGGAASQDERPASGNLEAYNAYIQGKYYYARRSESDIRRGIALFEEAARLDAAYAQPWAVAARAWVNLGAGYLQGEARREAFDQAKRAAEKALALGPKLAEAHVARAFSLQIADNDFRAMEEECRLAVRLAPDSPTATFALGYVEAVLGRSEVALVHIDRALAGDPLHASWRRAHSGVLAVLGRLDEAERSVRSAIEVQPEAPVQHAQLGAIAVLRGDAAAALEAARKERPGLWQDYALALAHAIGGDRAAADAALTTLIEKHGESAAMQVAGAYAARGEGAKVFEWLERAYAQRDPGLSDLNFSPLFAKYRGDPRYAAFCLKVGLPAPGGVAGT